MTISRRHLEHKAPGECLPLLNGKTAYAWLSQYCEHRAGDGLLDQREGKEIRIGPREDQRREKEMDIACTLKLQVTEYK